MSVRNIRHDKYKHAGLKWLGDIPSDWETKRAKYIFEEINERSVDGSEVLLSVSEYYGVKPRASVKKDDEFLSRAESLEGYKKCSENDLVMNIMLAWKRGLGFSKYNGIVSPAYSVFRADSQCHPNFLHYLLRTDTYTDEFKRWSTGIMASRLRLYPESFGNISILLPSLKEQRAIASFLDRETGKIDVLIGRQERMMVLLKEKRQAVISHAVTKGLNPNAPMKDSGVEWLGEIPEHWTICQFRRLVEKLEQGWSPVADNRPIEDGECGVVKLSAIKKGVFIPTEAKALSAEVVVDPRLKIHNGDVLFTRGNTPDLVGDVAYVEGLSNEHLLFSDLVYRVSCTSTLESRYLTMWLISTAGRFPIKCDARGTSMTMAKISQEHIKSWRVVFPPVKEQASITQYLETETSKIDNLIAKTEQAIGLMKERRTALISSAVTGKIDVREAIEYEADESPQLLAAEDGVKYQVVNKGVL